MFTLLTVLSRWEYINLSVCRNDVCCFLVEVSAGVPCCNFRKSVPRDIIAKDVFDAGVFVFNFAIRSADIVVGGEWVDARKRIKVRGEVVKSVVFEPALEDVFGEFDAEGNITKAMLFECGDRAYHVKVALLNCFPGNRVLRVKSCVFCDVVDEHEYAM